MSATPDLTPTPVALGPTETAPGRPFTAVENTSRDVSILYEILGDLLGALAEKDAGRRTIEPFQRLSWKIKGLTHRVLITDEGRLRDHERLCVVGFFGEKTDADPAPLDKANTEVVAEFGSYPGILSYSSMQIPGGQWGNLVLHDDPIDREYWSRSELHADAVRTLAPIHYKCVRIHNAELVGGAAAGSEIVVLRTKYFDYTGETEWRAERELTSHPG